MKTKEQPTTNKTLETLKAIQEYKQWKPEGTIEENLARIRDIAQRSKAYYGVEIVWRNHKIEHFAMVTSYGKVDERAREVAHSDNNPTKMTPKQIRIFLLKETGHIQTLLTTYKPYSRHN